MGYGLLWKLLYLYTGRWYRCLCAPRLDKTGLSANFWYPLDNPNNFSYRNVRCWDCASTVSCIIRKPDRIAIPDYWEGIYVKVAISQIRESQDWITPYRMGADAIMEYQYSVIATIRDILWGGKKAASRPEYLTIIIILGIEHSSMIIQANFNFMHFS